MKIKRLYTARIKPQGISETTSASTTKSQTHWDSVKKEGNRALINLHPFDFSLSIIHLLYKTKKRIVKE